MQHNTDWHKQLDRLQKIAAIPGSPKSLRRNEQAAFISRKLPQKAATQ